MNRVLVKLRTRLALSLFVLLILAGSALMLVAHPAATTVTIVNNSAAEVRHVYFSPTNSDNWGPDQLNGATIYQNGSHTLSVSCDQASIKVIAEDKNGCFLYQVVSCGENSTWTIPSNAAPDCGN